MAPAPSVVLKGELHSSPADLEEEKDFLAEDVDALVLERGETTAAFGVADGWFYVSIALLTWLLENLYHPTEVLVDLATVQGIDVTYTRPDDLAPLGAATRPMQVLAASLFYLLVPGSLWIGFLTGDTLTGSLLLFLGLVLPVLAVRIYNTNRPDGPDNRDARIAETIVDAAGPSETVLAIVGARHVEGVERRLPDHVDVTVRPPAYGVWSLRHLRDVGLPTVKAGFVLFSLYVLSLWVVVRVVGIVAPVG